MAAAADRVAYAFPQLPLEPVLSIFLLLPVDQRLRCAEVSRAWRATVVLPALWRRLDLSLASGVARVSAAMLRAAVARAGSALTVLDVSGVFWITPRELCAAVRASTALVEVHYRRALGDAILPADVTALLDAAPQLHELHTCVSCEMEQAIGLLECRPQFASLHVHGLTLQPRGHPHWMPLAVTVLPPALTLALADARLQPRIAHLQLRSADFRPPGAFDLLADAVVARRLSYLMLNLCALSPAVVPPLARALRDGALTSLIVAAGDIAPFLDAAVVPTLRDALRANSTLTSLALVLIPRPAADAVAALLGSLVAHRSLRKLVLFGTPLVADAAGPALAALIAADAPALTELNISGCGLGEAGLGAFCDALPHNRHLCQLDLRNNAVPAGFMHARMLPAVRANTSLRTLHLVGFMDRNNNAVVAQEAERIVAAR